MRISLHADYALRLLLLVHRLDRVVTIAEAAKAYGISRDRLQKVARSLTTQGYLTATRGRGGVRLARAPEEIRIGAVARDIEPSLDLVECFSPETDTCRIARGCGLEGALAKALECFLAHLDGYTLTDLALRPRLVAEALEI